MQKHSYSDQATAVIEAVLIDLASLAEVSERRTLRARLRDDGIWLGEFWARCTTSSYRVGIGFFDPGGEVPADIWPWEGRVIAGRRYGWYTRWVGMRGEAVMVDSLRPKKIN